MKTTTTENKVYDLSDSFQLAFDRWNFKIQYSCNQTASQQKTIVDEFKTGNETFVLRGGNGKYFIEVYNGVTMYPAVFKVDYTEPETKEVAESEFEEWLKNRKS